MAERGWTLQQVKDSIEQRKPDFAAYVAPQMEYSDVVISVLPSDISKEEVGTNTHAQSHTHVLTNYSMSFVGKHLKVKLIQKLGKEGLKPAYILDKDATVAVHPPSDQVKTGTDHSLTHSFTCLLTYLLTHSLIRPNMRCCLSILQAKVLRP